MVRLSPESVRKIVDETAVSFPHAACLTCECFLGLIAQLRVDSEPEAKDFLKIFLVDRTRMHACLGCDPCPPGDRYAVYMREKRFPGLISL